MMAVVKKVENPAASTSAPVSEAETATDDDTPASKVDEDGFQDVKKRNRGFGKKKRACSPTGVVEVFAPVYGDVVDPSAINGKALYCSEKNEGDLGTAFVFPIKEDGSLGDSVSALFRKDEEGNFKMTSIIVRNNQEVLICATEEKDAENTPVYAIANKVDFPRPPTTTNIKPAFTVPYDQKYLILTRSIYIELMRNGKLYRLAASH
jgi:hypothetical protein